MFWRFIRILCASVMVIWLLAFSASSRRCDFLRNFVPSMRLWLIPSFGWVSPEKELTKKVSQLSTSSKRRSKTWKLSFWLFFRLLDRFYCRIWLLVDNGDHIMLFCLILEGKKWNFFVNGSGGSFFSCFSSFRSFLSSNMVVSSHWQSFDVVFLGISL